MRQRYDPHPMLKPGLLPDNALAHFAHKASNPGHAEGTKNEVDKAVTYFHNCGCC